MLDFQAFTVKFSARTNILFSTVGISRAFDPKVTIVNQPQVMNTQAIWDTGASCTVISKELAIRVGLIPTGKTKVTGVNHISEENTYLVNLYLPNKVCIAYLKIVEVPALIGGAGMLIGMDIIGSGDFSIYAEDGKTIMTYRFPSIGGTDFVQVAGNIRSQRAISQKIEKQIKNRKLLSKKEREKRKKARKNRRKQKKNRR